MNVSQFLWGMWGERVQTAHTPNKGSQPNVDRYASRITLVQIYNYTNSQPGRRPEQKTLLPKPDCLTVKSSSKVLQDKRDRSTNFLIVDFWLD